MKKTFLPADGIAWLTGRDSRKVRCGGHWYASADFCRSSSRDKGKPTRSYDHVGFRLAYSL